jgi:hypothetical protein
MGDSPNVDDAIAEKPPAPTEAEEAPKPAPQSAPAEVVFEGLAQGKEAWRGGAGCSSRFGLYGCLLGLALLIGMLFVGTSMMRRTVWVNLDRGRRVLVRSLPRELPAAERQRTIQNLDRFRVLLEKVEDPYPLMGEFMNRVRDVLDDGRLTVDEVGGLNVYLERVIEESGIPPMQLGARIRNSEFGIRNAGFSAVAPNVAGGAGGNSKFRIPNSEFV